MVPAPFIVVVDANVLFPLTLRDTILRAAAAGFYQLRCLPDGLETQSPDEFLCNLFDLDPEGFVEMLHEQSADLVNPPVTVDEILDRLARVTPDLVAAVRQHVQGIGTG